MEGHYAGETMENFAFKLASVITGLDGVDAAAEKGVNSDSSNKNSVADAACSTDQSHLSTNTEVGGANSAVQSNLSVRNEVGGATAASSSIRSDLPAKNDDEARAGRIDQSNSSTINERGGGASSVVDQSNSSTINERGGGASLVVDQSNSSTIHEAVRLADDNFADESEITVVNIMDVIEPADQSGSAVTDEVEMVDDQSNSSNVGGGGFKKKRGGPPKKEAGGPVKKKRQTVNCADQSNSSTINEVGGAADADQSSSSNEKAAGGYKKKKKKGGPKKNCGVTDKQRTAIASYVVAKIREAMKISGKTRIRLLPSVRSKNFWQGAKRDPLAKKFDIPVKNAASIALEFSCRIVRNLSAFLTKPEDYELFQEYLQTPADKATPVIDIFPPEPKYVKRKQRGTSAVAVSNAASATVPRGTSGTRSNGGTSAAIADNIPPLHISRLDDSVPFLESEREAMCQFAAERFRDALLAGGPEAAWKVHPARPSTWQLSELGGMVDVSAKNLHFRLKKPEKMAAEFAFHLKMHLSRYVKNRQDLFLLQRNWYSVPKYSVVVDSRCRTKADRAARRKKYAAARAAKKKKKSAAVGKQQPIKSDPCRCLSDASFFCGSLTDKEHSAMCRFVLRKLREAVESRDPAAVRLAHPGFPFVWRLVGNPHESGGDERGFRLKRPNQMASEFTLRIKPNLAKYLPKRDDRLFIFKHWTLDKNDLKYYDGHFTDDENRAMARFAALTFRLAVESRDFERVQSAHPGQPDIWRLEGDPMSTEGRGFRLKKPKTMAAHFRRWIKPNLHKYLENDDDICIIDFNWYSNPKSRFYRRLDDAGEWILTPKETREITRLERLIGLMRIRAEELSALNRELRNRLCLQKLTNFDRYLSLQRENQDLEKRLNIRDDEDLLNRWSNENLLTEVNKNSTDRSDKCIQTEICITPRNYGLQVQELKKTIAGLLTERIRRLKLKLKKLNTPNVQEITID